MTAYIPSRKLLVVLTALIAPLNVSAQNQQVVQARLLSQISTRTNRAGDKFSLTVIAPSELKDGIVEGHIVTLKQAGDIKGNSEISFAFDTLSKDDRTLLINGDLTDVQNSKGARGVDEEGRTIGGSSLGKNIRNAALLGGGGAALGWLLGGKAGLEKGAATGIVAATVIALTTKGPQIEFSPQSVFTFTISERIPGGGRQSRLNRPDGPVSGLPTDLAATGPTPPRLDEPFMLNAANLILLERGQATREASSIGTRYVVQGAGLGSPLADRHPKFVIQSERFAAETIELYQLVVSDGNRLLNNLIPIPMNVHRLYGNTYQLEPRGNLVPGAYTLSRRGVDEVFCFRVE